MLTSLVYTYLMYIFQNSNFLVTWRIASVVRRWVTIISLLYQASLASKVLAHNIFKHSQEKCELHTRNNLYSPLITFNYYMYWWFVIICEVAILQVKLIQTHTACPKYLGMLIVTAFLCSHMKYTVYMYLFAHCSPRKTPKPKKLWPANSAMRINPRSSSPISSDRKQWVSYSF